jgi:germination protein M
MARRNMAWALVLLMAVFLVAGCSSKPKAADVQTSAQQVDTQDTQTSGEIRKTILYYRDASGYQVPVMRKIPLEDGIAKAALKCLVAGATEDATLASMGLQPSVPKGTTFDLDIADGKATVNLKMTGKCATKQEEQCMIASVVNTLLGFSTVKEVSLQLNGQEVDKLPCGAVVESKYTAAQLNIEPAGAPGSADGKVQLCFTNATGKVIIPIYRVADNSDNLSTALGEMMKPADGSELVSLFPPSCDVLSAGIKDGVAEINLSKEFSTLSDNPALESVTVRALDTVCKQFKGVKSMKLLVEGKAFEPSVSTSAGGGTAGDGFLNTYN